MVTGNTLYYIQYCNGFACIMRFHFMEDMIKASDHICTNTHWSCSLIIIPEVGD